MSCQRERTRWRRGLVHRESWQYFEACEQKTTTKQTKQNTTNKKSTRGLVAPQKTSRAVGLTRPTSHGCPGGTPRARSANIQRAPQSFFVAALTQAACVAA
eukprot:2940692-Pyramimonas_sp.AAC.1